MLGLSIDDPDNSPNMAAQAQALIEHLRAEFASPAGCAGVELAPAHSRQEWENDGLVQIRVGELARETLWASDSAARRARLPAWCGRELRSGGQGRVAGNRRP